MDTVDRNPIGPVDVDLDDLLNQVENDPDSVAPDALQIVDLDRAARAVRRRADADKALAEQEAVYKAERERLDLWIEGERRRHGHRVRFIDACLEVFHRARLAEDPTGAKTIRLPHGELVARKAPDTVRVDDDVFVPWAEKNAPDLLNPPKPRTPAKTAIRAAIGDIMADGTVVNADTGEFLPGVVFVDGEVRFTVKTEAG